MRHPARQLLTALLVTLAVTLAACADDTATGADDEPAAAGEATPSTSVVVTTSILGDIASNVLADTGAAIEVIMPPGTDPHGYAPSAADGVTLREADLVVAVGLGLEEALEDTLESAEADGVEVFRVGPLVDPVEYGATSDAHADEDVHADEDAHGDDAHGDGEHGDDEHGDDEHGDDEHGDDEHGDDEHGDDEHADGDVHAHQDGPDPHVWLDPLRAAQIGQEIAAAYADLVPEAEEAVTAAADAYEAELVALDEELAALVASLPEERRALVTNHDAVGYLADRYDLRVVATVLPGTSADVDVTSGAFTRLVELLRETAVPAVFAETTSTDRLAQALAEEVEGVQVVELYTDSLGEPGSEGETLIGMLRTDIERIVDALG